MTGWMPDAGWQPRDKDRRGNRALKLPFRSFQGQFLKCDFSAASRLLKVARLPWPCHSPNCALLEITLSAPQRAMALK
jgi:hypothetical protein